jgi:hypothetical protein
MRERIGWLKSQNNVACPHRGPQSISTRKSSPVKLNKLRKRSTASRTTGADISSNAMHDFCRGADFKTRGIGDKRLSTGRDGVRFCFKEPGLAEAFQARFGGVYCQSV